MKRYIWPGVAILLLILSVYQFALIRQYRTEIGLYGTKVTNAFRYTGLHMDLTALPTALDALASNPSKETLAKAESAANDYTDLLFQINDLRESGPPMGHDGLQGGSGDFNYNPSTQAQADEQWQIYAAELYPSVQVIGVLLQRNNWQLRPEDKQFLSDAAKIVRQLNETLGVVNEALKRAPLQPSIFPMAQQRAGQIGAELNDLTKRIKEHRATVPAQ